MQGADWTLFTPSECPDLHDRFGKDFEKAYVEYEARAARGEMKLKRPKPCRRWAHGAKCWSCCLKPVIRGWRYDDGVKAALKNTVIQEQKITQLEQSQSEYHNERKWQGQIDSFLAENDETEKITIKDMMRSRNTVISQNVRVWTLIF